ncbi:type II toxin-antitoxin system death-on-curing family toxin [Sulfuriflexus sp.]|uniref:type II toxin-antitoxin system death-on-curing family toxin n=1 Tax=Sulfuriflexus sp. TaxID=2015443 RepID=UPI0028CC8AA9|nr:type II toxin-antitoxin system death-on-curing family toxin [Sulfuriflexus sp.]MDT8405517.1 type II toxin-antitoxin system death-on-curing family toxin [Sulfuriflexus sp.]
MQQVLFIHARLIETTGGEHGVRDLGLLQSAVFRPQATFDGKELYGDLFHKAASLLISLAQNHPFVDGNKRTAITAAGLFLRQNGWQLETGNEELERFTLRVVNEGLDLNVCAEWLEHRSIHVEK